MNFFFGNKILQIPQTSTTGSMDNKKEKPKLPVTEYVDTEERFCYGITPENETCTDDNEVKTENAEPQVGLLSKTGHLIGALGSGILSGATGAVTLGVNAVCSGVSVGSSAVSGVIKHIPFPRRASSTNQSSQPPEDLDDVTALSPPPAKPGILSKVLSRGQTKAKAD